MADDAQTLRRAAASIHEEYDGDEDSFAAFMLAVADWLETAGADLWAHGPLCCTDGCMECDDDLWAPHVRRALVAARAYLAIPTPDDAYPTTGAGAPITPADAANFVDGTDLTVETP